MINKMINVDSALKEEVEKCLILQYKNPVFKKFYLEKDNAIKCLDVLVNGNNTNLSLKYVYTGYDEYVGLFINGKLYKNKLTCVSCDSIPTMIKEAMNVLYPEY